MKQMRDLDMHHTTLVHTDIGVDEHHRFVESFRGLQRERKRTRIRKEWPASCVE